MQSSENIVFEDDAEKLRRLAQCGYASDVDIACCDPKEAAKKANIQFCDVINSQQQILDANEILFVRGDSILKQILDDGSLFFCGISAVDEILDGLEGGSTLLISGPSMSGKSRIASHYCAEALAQSNYVTWVEMSQQLDLSYIRDLVNKIKKGQKNELGEECHENLDADPEKYFEYLNVARVSAGCSLLACLGKVLESNQTDLLILDSLSLLFQSDFFQYNNESRIFYGALKEILREFQRKTNCAIIITNWVGLTCNKTSFSAVESSFLFGSIDYHLIITQNADPVLVS